MNREMGILVWQNHPVARAAVRRHHARQSIAVDAPDDDRQRRRRQAHLIEWNTASQPRLSTRTAKPRSSPITWTRGANSTTPGRRSSTRRV